MAAILGGALLVWRLTLRLKTVDDTTAVQAAERYEWVFWAAVGLQVMTGVGNLGAFGDSLPAPGSAWGLKLTIKLLAVLALAAFSVPRTIAVAVMATGTPRASLLQVLYGTTTAYTLGILGLAVWLAHG